MTADSVIEAAEPVPLSPAQQRRVEGEAERVPHIARAITHSMPQVSVEDLISAGNEGLVQAALRYDPASGVPFGAFAHYRIRGAMIDYARRAVPAVRRRTRALRSIAASQAVLNHAQREQAALDAHSTRTLQERVGAAANIVAQATAAIMLTKLSRIDPDAVAGERFKDAEQEVLGTEMRALLHEAIDGCAADDRKLIEALYFDDETMQDVARRMGKSVSTVSRRHARLMGRLGSRLKNRLSR